MGFSISLPTIGQPNSTEDVKVNNSLTAISTWGNGNIGASDFGAALAQSATVNQGSQAVKGATSIATSESRTNVAYGTLTTPDQVTGIVLPSNGLIVVLYQALWQSSVGGVGRAAVFIGANQLKAQVTAAAAGNVVATLAAISPGTGAVNQPLVSAGSFGIASASTGNAPADVTTGQVVGLAGGSTLTSSHEIGGSVETGTFPAWGAPIAVFAAAGTYTVSVQFKASSGSVTASNRRLWVQALSFA